MTLLDRPDFDPERDLDEGPYRRKGFTPELQQRIEDSIERKARTRWLRIPVAASAVTAVIALLFMIDWHSPPWANQRRQAASASAPQQASAIVDRAAVTAPAPYNSGLLLGLRTDFERKTTKPRAKGSDSSYRTLFIAPLNGQLDVAAEGKGILLPYGQTFWKIDSVAQSSGGSYYSTLIAHPANKPIVAPDPPRIGSEPLQHTEKLMFAGNKYVSLEQSETIVQDRKSVQTSRVWVKELKQVNGELTLPSTDPAKRSYVGFQDLFGAAVGTSDEWAIVRRPGSWTPSIASLRADGDKESYSLSPVPQTLPDAVVSHDQLCCTWADIKRVQPDAVDALSSPKKDFITIITPSTIYFYENRGGKIGDSPQLTINLNENESMIMAQWATGAYVDEWVKASRSYLSVSGDSRATLQR